ncbi:LOW QUALITY PROTEIN: zf-RVT domain-containing protein, partial [Cephalotus follicularis]
DLLHISDATLPIRYLGLPLLSSKLTKLDCNILLKLLRRTSSWVSNALSFGGRLQLLSSVLFSIQVFWCSTFILPVAVCKECDRILRSFLWHGVGNAKRSGKVAWSKVCKPREEGGLGIKNCRGWNQAAILKIGWDICQMTCNSSWSWRSVLNARRLLADRVVYEVGNGQSFSLWFDPWLNGVSILDRYGARVIHDSGMGSDARVCCVINQGEWEWPLTSPELIDISNMANRIPLSPIADKIHWRKKGSSFTISDAWRTITPQSSTVDWWKIVWFPRNIPKHSFCAWLTFREAHRTLDKLVMWGLATSNRCSFGCGHCESIDHLFFECPFTARI